MTAANTPEGEDKNADESGTLFEAYADAVNQGDVEEQESATLKIWQHLAERKDDEPSPWLQAMGDAHQCEAAFDWVGAEEAYKRAIQATADQPTIQSGAYSQLSALYNLVNLDSLALEAAQSATQVARRDTIPSLLSLRLQAEAKFYLKAKDFQRTRTTLNEALAVIDEGPIHNLERAYALILHADCSTEEGDLTKAEADLASAWKLLEPHSQTFFAAGWQSGLAAWWATVARLRTQQNDGSAAVTAWREAVARRRIIAQLPQLEGPYKHNSLSVALLDLGRSLRQAGDRLAAESFQESCSIRRFIGLPPLQE
jgi:hypothetical protein